MNLTRRSLLSLAGITTAAGLDACARRRTSSSEEVREKEEPEQPQEPEEPEIDLGEFEALAIDMSAWQYDEANDCYYQLMLPYCLKPGSEQYESYAIFVPGAYFVGDRGSHGYTCTIAEDAQVGSFTPATAPVAMPLNAIHFGAQASPATYSYEGLSRYLEAGFVYVYAGFRGRSGGYESTTQEYFSGGIPWAVSDLKSAVRCLRYNAAALPCDTNRIFVFGCGGGGGYSAVMGASGNAETYAPYLTELGAATHDAEGNDLTDEIMGSASWCPIASFGALDAAYEWMMGQHADTETRAEGTWTSLLSQDLTEAYAAYLNGLSLTDGEGVDLSLDRIDDGSYLGGTYYEYLLALVRDAASAFLSSTKFPYTRVPSVKGDPYFPGDPSIAASAMGQNTGESDEKEGAVPGVRQVEATVFDSLESYVSYLNGSDRWLTFNASRGKADISGLWDFVPACRAATRSVCAYDAIDRSGVINQLFGTDEVSSLHFDDTVADLLEHNHERYAEVEDWDEGLVAQWGEDLAETDTLDQTVTDRMRMTDPLTYLLADASDDEDAATVAPHWRIHTGLFQSSTPFATEANLVLALGQREDVEDLEFEVVWDAGYELAERAGSAEDNLVSWICSCCPAPEPEPEPEPEEDASEETDDADAAASDDADTVAEDEATTDAEEADSTASEDDAPKSDSKDTKSKTQ